MRLFSAFFFFFFYAFAQERVGDIPPPSEEFKWLMPSGFSRYLSLLPLKPEGAAVLLWDGKKKRNQSAHFRVINLPIERRNLHQCADAAIRLRAEYLFTQPNSNIIFHATNGQPLPWSRYAAGERISLKGNRLIWQSKAEPAVDKTTFQDYLRQVFIYAGSISIQTDTEPISHDQVMPGDIVVQSGSPGHVVMIVGVVENDRGQKKVLLAQSYMPAQETHILMRSDGRGPWFDWPPVAPFKTPEWTFPKLNLRRWK